MSVEDQQSGEDLDQEFDAVPEPSVDEETEVGPAPASVQTSPPTGVMSAERLAIKALEAKLLGGERKLRRREVAAGAGVSILSARKIWRAWDSLTLGTRTWRLLNATKLPYPASWTWCVQGS